MIRRARPAETASLVALGESTGIFDPGESEVLLRDTLDALHQGALGNHHEVRVWADPANGTPEGWVYFAPCDREEGSWELYWIGVAPARQGQGIGRTLLRFVEDHVVRAGGKALYIETSTLPTFERTRRFYEESGYTSVLAVSPDPHAAVDDKATFRKTLRRTAEPSERAAPGASPFAIRAATPSDLASVVTLAMALGRQHEAYDPRRFRLDTFGATPEALRQSYERFFQDEIRRDGVVLFVADSASMGIVGYVYGRVEEPSLLELCDTAGWVHDLFVDERARGRAVGAGLVETAIAALRGLGAPQVMLSVSPKNIAARALFERFGFATTMLECRLTNR